MLIRCNEQTRKPCRNLLEIDIDRKRTVDEIGRVNFVSIMWKDTEFNRNEDRCWSKRDRICRFDFYWLREKSKTIEWTEESTRTTSIGMSSPSVKAKRHKKKRCPSRSSLFPNEKRNRRARNSSKIRFFRCSVQCRNRRSVELFRSFKKIIERPIMQVQLIRYWESLNPLNLFAIRRQIDVMNRSELKSADLFRRRY